VTPAAPAYGLWSLVVINSAVFIFFALSFTHPRTRRDWRAFGGFSAFLVALFTEMYGFPLTIYLLSGWLARRFPGADLLSHDFGHLPEALLGWKGDPHLSPLHILSNLFIAGGFILLASSWRAASQSAGYRRSLRPGAASAIPGLHRDHARLSAPMANPAHAGDVPDPRPYVCAARAAGRAGSPP